MRNLEFKVQIGNLIEYETKLQSLFPKFLGSEQQTDTYFRVGSGRLKLRESNLKSTLINYYREETGGEKISEVTLYQHEPNKILKEILTAQLGINVIVNKQRRKYSIGHAMFHFDSVAELGTFLEVEVTDANGFLTLEKMQLEVDKYLDFFELDKSKLITASYSDLLIDKENNY